jgi:septum formation protein
VLASASPRRRDLLATLCADFIVEPPAVDETLDPGPPAAAVARLALRKARAVATRRSAGIVLGADTIVVVDGVVLGKPSSPADAASMLRRLRGRGHQVMTGVAVIDSATGEEASETVLSRVVMKPYSDAEIAAYVATEEPLDKAGAYAIQGAGRALVAGLEGSWSNVVGLPLESTAAMLRRFGAAVSAPPAD